MSLCVPNAAYALTRAYRELLRVLMARRATTHQMKKLPPHLTATCRHRFRQRSQADWPNAAHGSALPAWGDGAVISAAENGPDTEEFFYEPVNTQQN
jgi:hypothetical protein